MTSPFQKTSIILEARFHKTSKWASVIKAKKVGPKLAPKSFFPILGDLGQLFEMVSLAVQLDSAIGQHDLQCPFQSPGDLFIAKGPG